MTDTSRYEHYLAHYRTQDLTEATAQHVARTLADFAEQMPMEAAYDKADEVLWAACEDGEPRARELYARILQVEYPGVYEVFGATVDAGHDPVWVLAGCYDLTPEEAREVADMLAVLTRAPETAT